MSSSLHLMTVASTAAMAEQLQQRLARHGVVCPPSSTLTFEMAVEWLARAPTKLDVIFYQCNGHSEQDLKGDWTITCHG